jgi:predicted lipoprotein with Yx(FWY)xxD motif
MRKAVAGAAVLAALAVALTACGGSEAPSSGPPPATTAAQAANGATVKAAATGLGNILVDAEGRTLYAFTKDKGDQSVCSGQCASNWPALTVTGAAKAGAGAQTSLLSTSKQANGNTQVTYGGRPLYYFAGDTNGQGVGGVWFVVRSDGNLVKSSG